ncbi:uncharacterized protein J3R85_001415 [Psidium guajava]|nr:uncharacterized protein J3R85_001415 [Psidium guajava]
MPIANGPEKTRQILKSIPLEEPQRVMTSVNSLCPALSLSVWDRFHLWTLLAPVLVTKKRHSRASESPILGNGSFSAEIAHNVSTRKRKEIAK